MIIYKDIITGDELVSETYKLSESDNIFYTCDIEKKAYKKNENFELEGANPSAEGGDEGGDDDEVEMAHNLEKEYGLHWLKAEEGLKPSADLYKAHLKTYVKKVMKALEASNAPKETIDEFKANAANGIKKIMKNYDNYDVLMNGSQDPDGMHVLVDFREDGVTPFALFWKHGLTELKV